MSEQTLFTYRKSEQICMQDDLAEMFELVMYLDSCSLGKTLDFQKALDGLSTRILSMKNILNSKYLFPSSR